MLERSQILRRSAEPLSGIEKSEGNVEDVAKQWQTVSQRVLHLIQQNDAVKAAAQEFVAAMERCKSISFIVSLLTGQSRKCYR